MNRREFLNTGLSVTAGSLLPSIAANPGFALRIMATDWGFTGSTEEFCKAAKSAGYDGIEVWWTDDPAAQKKIFDTVEKQGLDIAFLCGGWQPDFEEHLRTFTKSINAACFSSRIKPLYINCHSGKDYFTKEQNLRIIQVSTEVSKSAGIPIYHETHRGRMCFSIPDTTYYLNHHADMRLTLDISHWCAVHESLLADQGKNLALALSRADHIHARVGHPQGPQVNDPRAPEWKEVVNKHLEWWDVIVNRKKKEGKLMTILTEFGPADYMPTIPFTKQPIANQWEVNRYMMNLLRERYK